MKCKLLFALLCLLTCASVAAAQSDQPLKVAILTPAFGIRDNKAGYEAFPKWLEANYRVQVTLIVPTDRKMIPDLEKAAEADVVLTGLTHVELDEKQSDAVLKLYASKPLVGLRRCHHGSGFKLPKGAAVNSQTYGPATFGATFADHLQEKLRPREGQADHPILKGLTVADLYPKEHLYVHKSLDDLSVVLEAASGEPQVWTRTHPTSKQRIVYAIHDGHDLGRSEPVRTLIARAIFWAAGVNEDAYRKTR
jgi:hypothetical protein